MDKLERFNSYLTERLMSVAGEIFEAVKGTVCEYEEEIKRTKQENIHLKKRLSELTVQITGDIVTADTLPRCVDGASVKRKFHKRLLHSDPSTLQLKVELATKNLGAEPQPPLKDASANTSACAKRAHDAHPSHADGPPPKQKSSQRSLDSDPSALQLKLELATIKQESEPEPSLKDASTSTSCAKSAYDPWTSHSDASQGPQSQQPSLIQVKLEVATIQEETGPQKQSSTDKRTCGQEPKSVSSKALDLEERKDEGQHGNSGSTIKSESCSSEVPHCSAKVQSGSDLNCVKSEPGTCSSTDYNKICDDLSRAALQSQSLSTEEIVICGICGKPLSAWLLKKHMNTCHEETPYSSDLSANSYGDDHALKLHYKNLIAERPFQCEFCRKMYKKRSHLKDHERTHTGEKRYSCSACGKCFTWTNQVKVHIQNHHRGQLATVIKKSFT